jgi:hypothetical protein
LPIGFDQQFFHGFLANLGVFDHEGIGIGMKG